MQLRTTHIATMVVGVAVIASTAIVVSQSRSKQVSADTPVGTASMKVGSKTAKVGDEIAVDVTIDTGSNEANNKSSGADVMLSYDPSVLEPIDTDSTQPGIQVTAGKVFDFVQANKVDTTLGVISFSAGQQPTSNPIAVSQKVLASIRFKAKAAGRSTLRFSYTAGALDDTNIIQPKTGRDLLNNVEDGIVTVE
jgi:hypothetical protein